MLFCTDLIQYRTNDSSKSKTDAIIEDNNDYSLAFVEFDDQGSLWDRQQLNKVINRINLEGKKSEGLLLVVFIHGWKHNAKADDGNVDDFRKSLSRLANTGHSKNDAYKRVETRNIMGLYVGWRGLSLYPPVIKEITFWDRKNTAERVGHGAVTEFLIQVENAAKQAKKINKNTDLVVVGHSFGGLILYSALSQIMMERMVESSDHAFGDLVVMVNPAIEAARFTPLQQLASAQTYHEGHYPTIVVLTSKGDWATKIAFRIGRWFSTRFEKYRDSFQGKANRTAIGHFQPYTTHELIPFDEENRKDGISIWQDKEFPWDEITSREGYVINFDNVKLIHKNDAMHKSAPQNPIMVISVHKKVIRDHNDIFNEKLSSFLADLIVSKPRK